MGVTGLTLTPILVFGRFGGLHGFAQLCFFAVSVLVCLKATLLFS
jgi:hypothetical protein